MPTDEEAILRELRDLDKEDMPEVPGDAGAPGASRSSSPDGASQPRVTVQDMGPDATEATGSDAMAQLLRVLVEDVKLLRASLERMPREVGEEIAERLLNG